MSFLDTKPSIIEKVLKIAKDAGEAILDIYKNSNSDFKLKEDKSPLTKADIASHEIIVTGLKNLTPDIPILSEEDSHIAFANRSLWYRYWLIDPLDGTKEFLKRNGEFTVNIALMENNRPIFGIIFIPLNNRLFWGSINYGSYEINNQEAEKKIRVSNKNRRLIATSRSHTNKKIDKLLERYDEYKVMNIGSSLKFCLIANGEIDVYPRLGPTSEWDIAAGEVILKGAGGIVMDLKGKDIIYNKEEYINPHFIAASNDDAAKEILDLIKNKK